MVGWGRRDENAQKKNHQYKQFVLLSIDVTHTTIRLKPLNTTVSDNRLPDTHK